MCLDELRIHQITSNRSDLNGKEKGSNRLGSMLKKNQGRVGAPFLLQKNGIAEEWNRGRKE